MLRSAEAGLAQLIDRVRPAVRPAEHDFTRSACGGSIIGGHARRRIGLVPNVGPAAGRSGGAAIGIAVLGVLRDPVAGGRGRLEFFAGGGEHVLVDLGGHGGDDITGRRSDHRTADADLRCEQERGDGGKGARHDG